MSAARGKWRGFVRPARTLAWALLLATVTVLPALPAGGQDQPDDSNTESWCRDGAKTLDLLLLMDESVSLTRTDPNRQRIDAAKNLIHSLAEQAGKGVAIRVALAGFDTDFELKTAFTDLPEGADDLLAEVDRFTDDGKSTDYVLAMYGAITELEWAAECKRIIWYTDGSHYLSRGQAVRPYDALGREITEENRRAVERLLIPAVCARRRFRRGRSRIRRPVRASGEPWYRGRVLPLLRG